MTAAAAEGGERQRERDAPIVAGVFFVFFFLRTQKETNLRKGDGEVSPPPPPNTPAKSKSGADADAAAAAAAARVDFPGAAKLLEARGRVGGWGGGGRAASCQSAYSQREFGMEKKNGGRKKNPKRIVGQ